MTANILYITTIRKVLVSDLYNETVSNVSPLFSTCKQTAEIPYFIYILLFPQCTVKSTIKEYRGPRSSFGIATDYGLVGPGWHPGGDEIFRLSRPALGPTQLPVKRVPGLSPGVKCGRGVLLTTHPLLVPRSRKSRSIPLPTLWATPGL